MSKKLLVSADPFRELLMALNSSGPELRELQALRGPLVGESNPINILVGEFNDAVHGNKFVEAETIPALMDWSIFERDGEIVVSAPFGNPGAITLTGQEKSLHGRLLFALAQAVIEERKKTESHVNVERER